MVTFREVDPSFFPLYDSIPMNVDVRSEYRLTPADGGLGGLLLTEVPVEPCVKDLAQYERASEYTQHFSIATWRFYMAFDGDKPVGALTLAGPTQGMHMLCGRTDACVLWDVRVADGYKHQGVGQQLFDLAVAHARHAGYRQMIIECQNNNIPACRFYRKQGAVLGRIDAYAYYDDPAIRSEVQLVWYLDLT